MDPRNCTKAIDIGAIDIGLLWRNAWLYIASGIKGVQYHTDEPMHVVIIFYWILAPLLLALIAVFVRWGLSAGPSNEVWLLSK